MRYHLLSIMALSLFGCSAAQQAEDVNAALAGGDRLSVGTVQREIRQGMSGADVVAVLGSPNMVTSDGQRRETWVYDRISTLSVASQGGVGGTLILIGGSQSSGARATQQRTLTIIIRFDEAARVREFSYRSTSF
jgi:outer membrane protein assembly factor BamE (lipoprotein component of BamABCDE complex)